MRQFEKYSKPLVKALLSKGYHLTNNERVQESKQYLEVMISTLNQTLIDNKGQYLVGDRLGLADIAVCSMLAPILEIEDTPWERETGQPLVNEFQKFKDDLINLPLGQYIIRIYQTERNARVDWRGI